MRKRETMKQNYLQTTNQKHIKIRSRGNRFKVLDKELWIRLEDKILWQQDRTRTKYTGGGRHRWKLSGNQETSAWWHRRKSKWPETRGELVFNIKQEVRQTKPQHTHLSPRCDKNSENLQQKCIQYYLIMNLLLSASYRSATSSCSSTFQSSVYFNMCLFYTNHIRVSTVTSSSHYIYMGHRQPETTVQACVSTFGSLKLLDMFNKTSGRVPAVFVPTEPNVLRCFNWTGAETQSCFNIPVTVNVCSGDGVGNTSHTRNKMLSDM